MIHRLILNNDVSISGVNVFEKCDVKHRRSYRRNNLENSNAKWTGVITPSKFI